MGNAASIDKQNNKPQRQDGSNRQTGANAGANFQGYSATPRPTRRAPEQEWKPVGPKFTRRDLLPAYMVSDAMNSLAYDNHGGPVEKAASLLKTVHVDLRVDQNTQDHNTHLYDMANLIIRRGQTFDMTVTFDRDIDEQTDSIELVFVTGDRPRPSKKTLYRVPVMDKPLVSTSWGANIISKGSKTITYRVMTSADSIVAPWSLFVITLFELKTDAANIFRYKEPSDIYLLFNAWCKDDQVYMENDADRQEYVMNETGRIWVGSANWFSARPWSFGQFQKNSLPACLYALEISGISGIARSNAVPMTRMISKMANSNDQDNGILTGNWSNDFSGGTNPSDWNGTVEIMSQYIKTKRPVNYGQCWVFSGVVTTMCRSLGIPCRSVTNFESGHDTDVSTTIDFCFDKSTGRQIPQLSDSIWNFHVWNEAHYSRSDLPDGYSGWQVIDATPQELSEGVMQCGPCPVKAIKEGNIHIGYDGAFVFAEVNADKVNWWVDTREMTMWPFQNDTKAVGKKISTKTVGSSERNDITHEYKFDEGTPEEREAVAKARELGARPELGDILDNVVKDVEFSYVAKAADNGDMKFTLTMKSTAPQTRTVNIRMAALATYYIGIIGDEIKRVQSTKTVNQGETVIFEMNLACVEYINNIDAHSLVHTYVSATVQETNYTYATVGKCSLDKPTLYLTSSTSTPQVGKSFEVTCRFTNPLPVPLTNGKLCIEGPGIQDMLSIPITKDIQPGQDLQETISMRARFKGKREVIACYNGKQLNQIAGAIMVDVQ